ncbi:MAG: FMN-binding protein, partial [Deltaproteobacteria bacterium]|nr:FMN-binding protein [Deltaproteobacteria bacterium]
PTLNAVFRPYNPTNDFLKDKVKVRIGEDSMGRQQYAEIYFAKKGSDTLAMATIVNGRGYGGVFTIFVAADAKTHEIIATKTLQQKETKSLGGRIANEDEPFVKQFAGMRIEQNLSLKSEGGDVDGMSGATITSGAFTKAVKTAGELFLSQKKK